MGGSSCPSARGEKRTAVHHGPKWSRRSLAAGHCGSNELGSSFRHCSRPRWLSLHAARPISQERPERLRPAGRSRSPHAELLCSQNDGRDLLRPSSDDSHAISDFTSNRYEESAKGRPRLVERTEAAFRRYPPNNSFACDYHPPRCCSRTCQRPNASEGGIRCAVACLHAVERTGPPERLVGGVRAPRSLLPRMYLD
ncbi:hypothetical protein MRX96_032243 [Rhipicephalus microplus]